MFLTGEWLNKLWSIHTMTHTNNEKEWTIDSTIWMNFQTITFSEKKQPQKVMFCMIPFT